MNRGGRVLVLEDAAAVRELVGFHLRRAGFQVIEADSATSAWPSVGNADLVVLDWMLPDEPGLVFLRRLRDRNWGVEVPVLMLTARATEMDRIEGLESGADDYLVKPFSVAELVARVRALLRRIQPADRVQIGPLLVDGRQGRVSLGGFPKELTRREFELIRFLAVHPGRVCLPIRTPRSRVGRGFHRHGADGGSARGAATIPTRQWAD